MSEPLPFEIPGFRVAEYARRLFARLGESFQPPQPLGEGEEQYEPPTRENEQRFSTRRVWRDGARCVAATEDRIIQIDADQRGWSESFSVKAEVHGLPGGLLRLEGQGWGTDFTSYSWEGDATKAKAAWSEVLHEGPLTTPLWLTHPTLPAPWQAEAEGLSLGGVPLLYELSPYSNSSMSSWPGAITKTSGRCAAVLLRSPAKSPAQMIALPLGPVPSGAEHSKPPFLYQETEDPARLMPSPETFLRALCETTSEPQRVLSGARTTRSPTPPGFLGTTVYNADESYSVWVCEGWRLRLAELVYHHQTTQSPLPYERQLALQREDGAGFALFLTHYPAQPGSGSKARVIARLLADEETTRRCSARFAEMFSREGWQDPYAR